MFVECEMSMNIVRSSVLVWVCWFEGDAHGITYFFLKKTKIFRETLVWNTFDLQSHCVP